MYAKYQIDIEKCEKCKLNHIKKVQHEFENDI